MVVTKEVCQQKLHPKTEYILLILLHNINLEKLIKQKIRSKTMCYNKF